MSKILNKIFDRDLYNTVKAERYELDQNGNKNMYNIGQLEGLAEQGNEEANVSDSWTSARKTDYLLANEEYDKSCKEIYNDLKQKLTALKSEFHICLKGFYTITPERIDNNVLVLLDSGIDVSEEEIDSLLFKYRFNTTMIRIVANYAIKNKKETKLLTTYRLGATSNGTAEMKAFERFEHFCMNAVSTNNALRRANAGCLDRLGAEALESLDEIAIKPQ